MKALRAEHRHIATVMQLFADQLKAIESGELVDTHVVYEIMDYMVTWPDRYHHPREDLIYGRVAELDARLPMKSTVCSATTTIPPSGAVRC